MSINKHEIPLIVLETIDNLTEGKKQLFRVVSKDKRLARFEQKNLKPDLYFEFVEYKNNSLSLVIKPRSDKDPGPMSVSIKIEQVESYFNKWINYLERYETSNIFEDPILKNYEQEAIAEFNLTDSEFNNYYDYPIQLAIDNFLGKSLVLIEKHASPNEKTKEIKNDLDDLRKTQTVLTKKEVIERLAKVFAKIRKEGFNLFKMFYQEAQKELFKRIITSSIDLI